MHRLGLRCRRGVLVRKLACDDYNAPIAVHSRLILHQPEVDGLQQGRLLPRGRGLLPRLARARRAPLVVGRRLGPEAPLLRVPRLPRLLRHRGRADRCQALPGAVRGGDGWQSFRHPGLHGLCVGSPGACQGLELFAELGRGAAMFWLVRVQPAPLVLRRELGRPLQLRGRGGHGEPDRPECVAALGVELDHHRLLQHRACSVSAWYPKRRLGLVRPSTRAAAPICVLAAAASPDD
mmetsp:Transcript_89714/g.289911  ORF Transcript_89714/g.289911 Transcript_89714/m.289911 type:complete len:236 (-) Transcript_89714:32-739(-)